MAEKISPEVVYKNRRLNFLVAAAFLMVIVCLAITVLMSELDEYAKGIITFLLGKFSSKVDDVYAFEFNTTRGSKAKDDTISNLAAASPIAPSVVTAAAVDAAAATAAASVLQPEEGKTQ